MKTADDILVPFTKEEYKERGCKPRMKGFIFAPVIPVAFINFTGIIDFESIEARCLKALNEND